MPRVYATEKAAEILPLLGESAVVLHGPDPNNPNLSGRDIDCVVHHLDQMWPLRLQGHWRLCQQLNYDLRAWYSILERNGVVVHLDTIDDPHGLGRYGFPTDLLRRDEQGGPRPGVQAAYLAVKRLQKGDRSPGEWARIGDLAARDLDCFEEALGTVLGQRTAALVRRFCIERTAPDPATWRYVRCRQRSRRARTPAKAGKVLLLRTFRIVERARHPTGMSVLVVGPDGAGKSALTQSLTQLGQELFRRQLHWHWRPQLLPSPATLLGRQGQLDYNEPHGRPRHGRLVSAALVGYYWLDSLLGGLLRDRLARVRSGFVIVERGWWDLLVDPARYRIRGAVGLSTVLGRLLPKPDLVLILDAPAHVLLRRKAEISAEELDRQTRAWEIALPKNVRRVRLDASRPFDQVGRQARQEIVALLEARAVARVGSGWTRVPVDRFGSVMLPRGPRRAAKAGFRVFHPATRAEWAAWLAARCFASLGGLRLLPSGAVPPKRVRETLAPYFPAGGTLAVAAPRGGSCYLALIVDSDGRSHTVAKIAVDNMAAHALDHEAAAIRRFGNLLRPPLSAPTLLVHEPGLLLLAAVPWRPRPRTARLQTDVAWSLGAFFASKCVDGLGPAHGRLTPGSLLRHQRGWVLCDWGDASVPKPPFYDLVYYLIAVGALAERALIPGLRHPAPWVRHALQAYASAAGIPASMIRDLVEARRSELATTVLSTP